MGREENGDNKECFWPIKFVFILSKEERRGDHGVPPPKKWELDDRWGFT
jgi:hypothetical protein